MADILYKQLSYDVVGCAQRVHAALGPGFPETVYHKALAQLTNDHLAQVLSYLKATGLKLAILINFGTQKLETQRVLY